MELKNFLMVNSFGEFKSFSTSIREEIVKDVEVKRVERSVQGKMIVR